MKRFANPFSASGRLSRAAILGSLTAAAAGSTVSCLDRPVSPQEPTTTNVFVENISVNKVDKIDLLFMIDNSISMADKQALLADAVPQLLRRFITPICVDEAGQKVGDSANGTCATGTIEFEPINDIHIGVISSSLGGHGGVICSPVAGPHYNETQDDKGEMVGLRRTNIPAPPTGLNGSGFLEWKPGVDADQLINTDFTSLVKAVGEDGCGYEASLEAWYRFLVDPEPPSEVPTIDPTVQAEVVPGPVNQVVLDQRAQFLRPDSLLAVIMLSDENDCSIKDEGVSWLVGSLAARVPRARAICATEPNNECCSSCADKAAEEKCGPAANDASCQLGEYQNLEEPLNLRCFEQRRRFGIDFLYPVQRYINALLGKEVTNRAGQPVPNPLVALNPVYPGQLPRTSTLIYAAAIVGVPWQNLATDETRDHPTALKYKTASAIKEAGEWDLLIGAPDKRDPFMIESVNPRSGTGKYTGPIAPPNSAAGTSPVNGHEYDNPAQDDLQYACIYSLAEPRDCPADVLGGCDCKQTTVNSPNRPLCQAPDSTASGTMQYYAKAYPGLRFLQVMEGIGANAILASVCPKDPINATNQDYGYNPAVSAIVDRLKEALKGTCLPRPLQVDPNTKRLACQVIEATFETPVNCGPGSTDPYREDPEEPVKVAVRDALKEAGTCGEGTVPCESFTLCRIKEVPDGEQRNICENTPGEGVNATGYCYIDPAAGIGNEELVADCNASSRRILRFVSAPGVDPEVPYRKSQVLVACLGQTIKDTTVTPVAPPEE